MKTIYLTLALGFLMLGCLGLQTQATEPDPCTGYDNAYIGWTATGAISSGLGGAAGGLAAVFQDEPDALIGLAVSSAVLGALGVAATFVANLYAQRYTERCGGVLEDLDIQPSGPQPTPEGAVPNPADDADPDEPGVPGEAQPVPPVP